MPAFAAAFVFAPALSANAQKIAPPKEKKATKKSTEFQEELVKRIGKADGDLFNGIMNQFGDGTTQMHLVTESNADIKQNDFTGSISGRSEMRGNFGGAFSSMSETTFSRGDQSATVKMQFVCDGKTFWAYKPDTNQYTEQAIKSTSDKVGFRCDEQHV